MAAGKITLRRLLEPSGLKISVLVSIVVAALYLVAQSSHAPEQSPFGRLESTALDLKFQLRGAVPPSGRVTVVAIDEKALARFGRWPWDRTVMARLVSGLTKAKARVIALDMAFTEPERQTRYSTLKEVQAIYRRSLDHGGAVEQGGHATPTGVARGDAALDTFFTRELADGGPDDQLARSIFDSGRVVWGLFAYLEKKSLDVPASQLDADYAAVAPFAVHHLYAVVHSAQGEREKIDPEMSITDPRFDPVRIRGGMEAPLPELRAATPFFGMMDVAPDPDGVMRRADLLARYRGVLLPSLPLRAVAAYLDSRIYPIRDALNPRHLGTIRLRVGSADSEGLAITAAHGALGWMGRRPGEVPPGPWEAPWIAKWKAWRAGRQKAIDDAPPDADVPPADPPARLPGFTYDESVDVPLAPWQRGRVIIDHLGPRSDYDEVSAADVIDGNADPKLLAGRIAVVGVTAVGTHDQRVTPFDSFLPGVYVQAALIDNLLTGRFIERPSWIVLVEVTILLLIGLIVGLVMPRMRSGLAIGAFLALGLGLYALVDQVLFTRAGIDLFVMTPMATFIGLGLVVAIFQWVVVDKEKRQVRRAFQHYLAPSVLESVLGDPKKLALEPGKAELTVLFSDIRGFTTISERLPPEQLATVLNDYLTPMTHIVFEHGGTLDKYMGDAIMAFWGDPVPQPDHALRACQTAVAMIERLEALSRTFEARGWPAIEIGIGINTGPVSVGNFGSDVLFDYTVMGDAVNLGSRLEGTNKQYGTRIIISEFTLARVEGQVVVRELDAVRVKGKREPVRIFELLSVGQPTAEDSAFIAAFADALAHYKQQLWDEAIAAFEKCAEMRPGDYPSQMYVARCHAMKAEPPGPGWDGVYTMTSK